MKRIYLGRGKFAGQQGFHPFLTRKSDKVPLVHYSKKLFKLKIKEVIDREVQLQDELIKNHQTVIDELKQSNWEKLNAKQSELVLLQEHIEKLKADNDRLEKTIAKINSQYYHLVEQL